MFLYTEKLYLPLYFCILRIFTDGKPMKPFWILYRVVKRIFSKTNRQCLCCIQKDSTLGHGDCWRPYEDNIQSRKDKNKNERAKRHLQRNPKWHRYICSNFLWINLKNWKGTLNGSSKDKSNNQWRGPNQPFTRTHHRNHKINKIIEPTILYKFSPKTSDTPAWFIMTWEDAQQKSALELTAVLKDY